VKETFPTHRIYMFSISITRLIVSEISAFIRTDRRTDGHGYIDSASGKDGQTDMARSTRLVILITIYLFMGSETVPSACYILPTNLVYHFTLRVTGIVNIYSDLMGFQYLFNFFCLASKL